jgi:phage-related protein
MADWSIEFYVLENDESPIATWYDAQNSKVQAKLLHVFELLEELGIEVGMPHVKPLGDKLYEIRIRVDSSACAKGDRHNFRVIYFAYTDRRFILLHGFQKKTQKTPSKELEMARKYIEDFLERSSD